VERLFWGKCPKPQRKTQGQYIKWPRNGREIRKIRRGGRGTPKNHNGIEIQGHEDPIAQGKARISHLGGRAGNAPEGAKVVWKMPLGLGRALTGSA